MSCAPPSGWAVTEWTVDAGSLVVEGQGSEILLAGTIVSVSSYMEYRENDLFLSDRVYYSSWLLIIQHFTIKLFYLIV
jgi:hypothetical protein